MNEPTFHTRRKFIRTGVLGGAMAWTLPVFLEKTFFALDAAAADAAVQTMTGKDSPILVVLQLAGGNDGLNTVVPISDDAYYKARPRIGIAAGNTLKLNDNIGLNSRLTSLRGLYDSGDLALIQGVGYPNPNRSHFRSTDIWQTATDADKFDRHGWLGRYFDSCCEGEDPSVGVSVGRETPLAFSASKPKGITLARPEQFRFIAESASNPGATEDLFREMNGMDSSSPDENSGGSVQSLGAAGGMVGGDTMDYLRRTALDAQVSSDKILEITRKVRSSANYPGSQLANSLSLVSRLIAGGMSTRVYYVSQGGYDTHSNQSNSHDRLMGDLDAALGAFVADLKAQGNFDRVMLMTFSEFGRRVTENNSGGTDHGAAAPMFVLGGGVKPGIYGKQPSLTELSGGDLAYNVDFRSVYATVLDNWMKAPSEKVLRQKFQTMAFA
jgi:uncharacterized protein (DUF1501 family)